MACRKKHKQNPDLTKIPTREDTTCNLAKELENCASKGEPYMRAAILNLLFLRLFGKPKEKKATITVGCCLANNSVQMYPTEECN